MDPRDAREESADCMMCLVLTGWSDSMLRDMVSRYKKVLQLFSSVADSNLDPSDPYVFRLPGSGSGSISQRYGSGSFYHQAKIVRKTLIPTAL
jgi:hypothetical protein